MGNVLTPVCLVIQGRVVQSLWRTLSDTGNVERQAPVENALSISQRSQFGRFSRDEKATGELNEQEGRQLPRFVWPIFTFACARTNANRMLRRFVKI